VPTLKQALAVKANGALHLAQNAAVAMAAFRLSCDCAQDDIKVVVACGVIKFF
jgi:hypothetical protein